MTSQQSRLLQQERHRGKIDVHEMSVLLHGSEESLEMRKKMEGIVFSDPVLRQDNFHHLSRIEEYQTGLHRTKRAVELFRELKPKWGSKEATHFWRAVDSETLPISLNLNMFSHALKAMGNEEQNEKWVPLARNFNIIGCYAQTELGHGSFVRGLETRAEYDQTTGEFILNTPSLTAMKWWPGSMGKTASHALVMAKLFLAGKDRGYQMFLVQLRDMDTHQPLPGVTVGSIGPRMAFSPVDNGFLSLNKVRIPRDMMMAKFCEVTPEGRFVIHTTAKKASYGTMLFIRSYMVLTQGIKLSRAVTIAIRYSAVRQQGHIDPKSGEVAVLDYVSQQHVLFPLLATAIAYWHVGTWLVSVYEHHRPGNAAEVQELHATSACLKALTAYTAVRGIETCRRACGGHGYSSFSGLPHIHKYTAAAEIYEGDALVLYLQGARYLMKTLQRVQSGDNLAGDIKYLEHWLRVAPGTAPIIKDGKVLESVFNLANVFECSAARMIALAGHQLAVISKDPALTKEQSWNKASPWLIRAAEAHGEALLVTHFLSVLDGEHSEGVQAMLECCVKLYALCRIEANATFFLETGTLKPGHLHDVHDLVLQQLKLMRPQAISLVDSFCHADEHLHSALGAYDGDVYTRMYRDARNEPLNKTEVADGIHKYLKPLMKAKL